MCSLEFLGDSGHPGALINHYGQEGPQGLGGAGGGVGRGGEPGLDSVEGGAQDGHRGTRLSGPVFRATASPRRGVCLSPQFQAVLTMNERWGTWIPEHGVKTQLLTESAHLPPAPPTSPFPSQQPVSAVCFQNILPDTYACVHIHILLLEKNPSGAGPVA